MTHVGADGECMRCLVSFGFLSDEQQAEGAKSDKPVKPGPLRYTHFQVEVNADGYPKILGSGAMAVTYCARDTILNSTVALKVITRKLAENATARARFLREARAAAQIQHPNVARVIHYGEQDGECFYAMELVHGETLEERVQRDGPLPLSLALEVVEQTARGLAAGEACGVIHRDLKPSNLMTESDPSGQMLVKIIDYGVAKVMVSDPTLQTQTGFIGTPAFASPEQFNELGQQQVDTRSDVYSLGIVLWYLLTGQTPFAGQSLRQVQEKQAQQLPLEQLKIRHIPAQVTALIKSMLALDPAERPQTARELLSRLHGCYIRFEPRARARRRRWLIGAAAATLIALAVAIGTWSYQHARSAEQLEKSIAILPFENLTPAEEDAFFTIGMQDELTAQLSHLAGIKVIGAQSTRSFAPGAPRDLAAIGRELSVRHLLEGNVWRANGQVRIGLHLVHLHQPEKPWNESYERPVTQIFALESDIARAIAAQLGVSVSQGEAAALDVPPTNDLQAYDFYLRAIAIPRLVGSPAENVAMYERRIALLDQAVARDPRFVLAYCELAQAHDRLYHEKIPTSLGESGIDHRALAEAALEKARRIAPDTGRVHLALAQHFYSANDDAEQARVEIDLARQTLPNEGALEQLAGSIARKQGHWEDAVRYFQRAVTLEPRDTVSRFTLAGTYRFLRHYEDFDREMGAVIGFMSKKESSTYRLFRAFAPWEARGEVTPLRIVLSTIDNEDDPDGRIRDLYGMFLAMADHDPDAVSRILAHAAGAAFVYNGVKYPKTWYQGLAARMRGDNTAARIAFGAARGEVEKATLANPSEGRPLTLLAMIDAGLEQGEQAIAEARRAVELEPFEKSSTNAPFVRCNLAVVYAWTGQPDLAIAELNSLVGKPAGSNLPAQPTYGDLKLNPVWDPLRRHPGFTGLMQKFAQPAAK
jgi:TolB-like protein/Flp pilus assembly protein TadD/tRNA A-37 threonylcarbamoyl transferase component Bud32